jgi:WD40 repeat protein
MLNSGNQQTTAFLTPIPTERATQVAWNPDGTLLAIIIVTEHTPAWRIELWQYTPRQLIASYILSIGAVSDVAVSRDGTYVAVNGLSDILVWRWRTNEVKQVRRIFGDELSFGLDGQLFDNGGFVWSPDPDEKSFAYRDKYPSIETAWSLATHPTMSLVAVGTRRGDIHLLRIGTAQETRLQVLSGTVTALAFNPQGTWIAAGGGIGPDGEHNGEPEVRIWDIQTGSHIVTLRGSHMIGIKQIAFSSDGRRVAALVEDNRRSWILNTTLDDIVRVWELP